MSTEEWIEDENHRTINGERWVARKGNGCSGPPSPGCELWGTLDCLGCDIDSHISCKGAERADGRNVRWYRLGSLALAFFDGLKEEPKPVTAPVRHLSEICMDGIRSSLKTLLQDRDQQAVEALRDSLAAILDARVQTALDAALVSCSGAKPAPKPAPEDDVDIIIDPTPEQVPEGSIWGAFWEDLDHFDECNTGAILKTWVAAMRWKHSAIVARGHLTPTELVARVRKMLAEKDVV